MPNPQSHPSAEVFVTFRLPRETKDALAELAKRNYRTLSKELQLLVDERLAQEKR